MMPLPATARATQRAWITLLALTVAACGGGGTNTASSAPTPTPSPSPSPPSPSPSPSPAPSPSAPMSCGGVTSTGSGNSTPLVVDGFPCSAGGTAGAANVANTAYISIETDVSS